MRRRSVGVEVEDVERRFGVRASSMGLFGGLGGERRWVDWWRAERWEGGDGPRKGKEERRRVSVLAAPRHKERGIEGSPSFVAGGERRRTSSKRPTHLQARSSHLSPEVHHHLQHPTAATNLHTSSVRPISTPHHPLRAILPNKCSSPSESPTTAPTRRTRPSSLLSR